MIRQARKSDEKQINELGLLLNKQYSKLFNLTKILKNNYNRFYVYELENKIIGFLHATVLFENVEIINIIVHPNYRNQKVASNLFDTLLSELSSDVKFITLEVSVYNKPAIAFYEKFGFEVISVRKNYYHDGDAYLLGRKMK